MFQSKNDILKMYANSIYLGNSIQRIGQASLVYFDVSPQFLDKGQILQILTTISSPTEQNPAKEKNIEIAKNLAKKLDQGELVFISPEIAKQNLRQKLIFDESFFEAREFIKENLKNSSYY